MLKEFIDRFIRVVSESKYFYLVVSILLLLVFTPLFEGFVEAGILMAIFFTATLISGTYAVSQKKHVWVTALILAFPMLVSSWMSQFVETRPIILLGSCFGILFCAFVSIIILSSVLRESRVTADVIYGAIAVYLLIGVVWSFIYQAIETVDAGSFDMPEGQIQETSFRFLYYSFVTLTTLGYGDISPLNATAGSFSVLEAALGQIYIAVLIARLVGIHTAQMSQKQ
jgi:hypothetical protein